MLSLKLLKNVSKRNKGKKEKETPKDCAAKLQGCALSLYLQGTGARRTRGSQEIKVREAGGSDPLSSPPTPLLNSIKHHSIFCKLKYQFLTFTYLELFKKDRSFFRTTCLWNLWRKLLDYFLCNCNSLFEKFQFRLNVFEL